MSGERGLFRIEVARYLAGDRDRVLLAQPFTVRAGATLIGTIFAAIIAFSALATFSKKQKVIGVLVPSHEQSAIVTPSAGVVAALYVADGELVAQGQRVALVSSIVGTVSGDVQAERVQSLAGRRALLERNLVDQIRAVEDEVATTRAREAFLRKRLDKAAAELELRSDQVRLGRSTIERLEELRDSKYISMIQFDEAAERLLEVQLDKARVEREFLQLQEELDNATRDVGKLSHKTRQLESETALQLSLLDDELISLQATREVVLKANIAGRVRMSSPLLGGSVAAGQTLLSVVPGGENDDGGLKVELRIPSNALPYVSGGEPVQVRINGLPHRKFGYLRGEIERVFSAASSSHAANNPATGGTASDVMVAHASLISPELTSGRDVELKPGMQVEADIILDRKTLIEWVFEPLLTAIASAD